MFKIGSFFNSEFFKNYIVVTLSIFAFILNLASFIILLIFINPSNSAAILHYNVYFGVDLIGDWWQTYLVPLVGFFIIVLNIFLADSFYNQKERIAAYILLLASLMIQFGIVIVSTSVALINY